DSFSSARDCSGPKLNQLTEGNPKKTTVQLIGLSEESTCGIIIGFELAAYRYEDKSSIGLAHVDFQFDHKKLTPKILDQAKAQALGINTARHLVNMPPNELHPVNFASLIQKVFRNSKS